MAAAQSIPILGSLVIARLFSPSEFGKFSAWLGVVLTAAIVVTGRFETCLAVEQDGEPRRHAVIAILATIILISIPLTLLMLAGGNAIPAFSGYSTSWAFATFPTIISMALVQTWQAWAAAEGNYRALSWTRITQALCTTSFQIIVGWIYPTALGLAAGYLIGCLFGLYHGVHMMPITLKEAGTWFDFSHKLMHFWKSNRRFPIYALPADIIHSASAQLPLILIASKFGAEASGLFALTSRVLGAPMGLLGVAVLDVFKRDAALSYRIKGHCRDEYIRTLKILAIGGAVFAAGAMLAAEPLFEIAFGDKWRFSGVIAIWLMPMYVLRFVSSPLSYVFYIAQKQHIDLLWQCALFVVTIATFTLTADFQSSVIHYAGWYALLYAIYLFLSYHSSTGKQLVAR